METLINIAAILVFAFVIFAAVAVGLRFLIPMEPYRPAGAERSKASQVRHMLADVVGTLAVLAMVFLAVEIRFAYGAPSGERGPVTVEVVEVGECHRATLGFGVSRTCELQAYSYQSPDALSGPIEVVSGDPVEAGDRVAHYSSSGWTELVLLGSGGSNWQPVAAEDRPNLVWLPTATLTAASLLTIAVRRRIFGRGSVLAGRI